jgi:hypothetical protein
MHVSSDDAWDVKITLQKLGQKYEPKVGKTNRPNHIGFVKIDLS